MPNLTLPAPRRERPTFDRLRRAGLVLCSAALVALGVTGCRNDMHDQPRFEPLELSTFYPDSQASRPMIVGTVPRGGLRIDQQMYAGRTGRIGETGAQQAGGQSGVTRQAPSATGSSAAGDSARGRNPGAGSAGVTANTPNNRNAAGGAGAAASTDPSMRGYTTEFPFAVTREVLLRGEARYNIYCSPCHGRTGMGNGMIVQRGLKAPPSFHEARLQGAPAGYIFDVITNGFGVMYPYGSRIAPEDRWKIIAYIRALQLSQNASVRDLSAEDQQNLERRMK